VSTHAAGNGCHRPVLLGPVRGGGRPHRVPNRSSGWLWGGFRSVPRRAFTVPDSLLLGLTSTVPRQRLSCSALVRLRVYTNAEGPAQAGPSVPQRGPVHPPDLGLPDHAGHIGARDRVPLLAPTSDSSDPCGGTGGTHRMSHPNSPRPPPRFRYDNPCSPRRTCRAPS